MLAEALAAARAIGDRRQRAEALGALAPQLEQEEKGEVLADAFAAAHPRKRNSWRCSP